MRNNGTKKQHYKITTVEQAKAVSRNFLKTIKLDKVIDFGLAGIGIPMKLL